MPRGTKKKSKKKPPARKRRKASAKSINHKVKYAKVPKEFEPIFARAQDFVSKYFDDLKGDARKGTIEASGERYLLVRSASMSVDFFEAIKGLYRGVEEEEALAIARNVLFDIAHAIGKADAKSLQKKMKLDDPVERLSAGPIHFAYSGWAFVDIFPESRPTPDDNYFLIYDHPYSFESAAWLKANKRSDCPVCVMNAGYSSGWCEESFGVTLIATEIMCKAAGDEACRFIMAPPSRIDEHVRKYTKGHPKKCQCFDKLNRNYEIPGFFKRKQIEQNLRESEEAFRLVFDNANDAIFWADAKTGILLNCNKAAEKLVAREKKDIVGMHQTLLHPPEEADEYAEIFKKDVSKRINVFPDVEVITPEGIRKPVEISASVTKVGEKLVAQGIFRDITGRKKAEDALRTSEEAFRLVFENANDAIFWADPESGNIINCNRAAERLLEKSRSEIIGSHQTDVHPPDKAQYFAEMFKKHLLDNGAVSEEAEIITASGMLKPVEINSSITSVGDKQIIQGVFRNIAERKEREEESRMADTFLEAMGEALLVVDAKDLRVIKCNAAILDLLGYTETELKSMSFDQFFPEEELVLHRSEMTKAAKDGLVHRFETHLIAKDGKRIPTILSGTAMNNDVGEVVNFVGAFTDITELKHTQEELEAARNNMEQRVELRTAELKRSQQLYQVLAEAAEDYIFIIGPDMHVRYVNRFAANALSLSKDEVIGKKLSSLFPEEATKRMQNAIGQVFSSGEAMSAENPFTFNDREIWLHTHLVPLKDEHGTVMSVMGLARDVTSRRHYEERLRLTQTTMDHVGNAIYWIRPDAKFAYVNDQACKKLGYSREELLNMTVHDIDPNFPREVWADHWRELKERGSFTFESCGRRKDGGIFPTEITVNYLEYNGREFNCAIVLDITERKAAEDKLTEWKNRYEAAVMASRHLLYDWDSTTNKVTYGGALEATLGYSEDQMTEGLKRWTELIHPEDRKRFKQDIDHLIETKESADLQYRVRRSDGKYIFVEDTGSFIADAEGNLTRMIGFVKDITERKEAEEELRQSEARLRTAVESFPFDFFIIGPDGRYAMVNTPCTGNWGNIIGKRPEDVPVDEKTQAIWKENNRRAFSGEVVRGEVEMTVHGKTQYFYNIIAPIHDEGKVYGVLGVNLNITERKMAEEALRESERRFQQVAESAEEWIWEVNEHGLYTYCNDVVENVLGYKPEELIGMMHFYDLFVPKDRENLKEKIFKLFQKKQQFREIVNINIRKDGKEVILETSGSPIIDRNGKLVGYRGVDTDITERKKAEKALKSALKMKSEFMAMMSHELRTPLTRIISSAHLVLRDPDVILPENRKANLGNVLASSDTLLLMINNVLEMARLEGGSAPIFAQDCNLWQIIRTCISSCEGMTGEKDLKFVANIDDSVAYIYTDKEKLGHILMNLVSNAIRYSDEGTVEIVARPSNKKGYVDIAVSDQGIGIPPERMSELFERFKQLEEITKRRPGGIGLGLAIVKANLDLIAGTIDVKSEVDKGSTFTITVPKKLAEKSIEDKS